MCGECVPTTSYMAGDGPAAMVIKIDERSERNNQAGRQNNQTDGQNNQTDRQNNQIVCLQLLVQILEQGHISTLLPAAPARLRLAIHARKSLTTAAIRSTRSLPASMAKPVSLVRMAATINTFHELRSSSPKMR